MLSSRTPPDDAVLDINLNGQLVYPVAELLRSRDIPYIFCTGHETAEGDQRYSRTKIVRRRINLIAPIQEIRQLLESNGTDPDRRKAA